MNDLRHKTENYVSRKRLDWEEYEAVTKYIHEALGKKYGVKVIGWGRNCKVQMKIMLTRANITKIDFGCKVISDEAEIMAMYYSNLHDPNGRSIPFSKYIMAFSDELKSHGELLKTATIDVPTDGKLYWRQLGNEVTLEKIAITGFVSKTDQRSIRSFRLTDQVWLIMKELSEKRNLVMSKSGGIWNFPSI